MAAADVLNLDSRPYSAKSGYNRPTFDAFFRDAEAALAAFRLRRGDGKTGLETLTLFLVRDAYRRQDSGYNRREPEDDARVAGLLTDPATSRLKQLTIACEHHYDRQYSPPLASLPCAATLRVLELCHCYLQPTSTGGLAFPRLTDLTLRDCTLLEGYLQVLVDAAPALTGLELVDVNYKPLRPVERRSSLSDCFVLPIRLRCPTVTALVLRATDLDRDELQTSTDVGIQLDMPSLRSFLYQGYPVKLSLTSPAPGLERVDLDDTCRKHYVVAAPRDLTSFSSTRVLKMRLSSVEDIVTNGAIFPNLELLELDGQYGYGNSKTAEALVGLLRSCPAMSELRLSALELGEVSEIPAALANNCSFSCLESLRKITLQFKSKEVNCLEVQLAKFLVENARLLEEMHIEDGIQFWPDHLRHKLPRWRAESFRRKNLSETASGFRVYQLANPVVDSKEQTW
ncbi:unnamed protein product [Alopecurus aequalis]